MTQILEIAGWIVAIGTASSILYKLYKMIKGIEDKLDKVDTLANNVASIDGCFNAQNEALKCLLRTNITSTYYKHVDDKVMREYEFEAMLQEAETYFALGGNSYIKKLYDDMCSWEVVS